MPEVKGIREDLNRRYGVGTLDQSIASGYDVEEGAGEDGGEVERKGRMCQGEEMHEGKIMAPLIKCDSVEWTVIAEG